MRRLNLRLLGLLSSGLLLVQTGCARADDRLGESTPPTGEVRQYTFERSKIFPGTVRDYWIYIPKQYDPARPACLYVNQDGIQYQAPDVFDQLIDKKEMPVVIGVFVTSGHVKAASTDALDRFNRSYEFDGLGFQQLQEILIPGEGWSLVAEGYRFTEGPAPNSNGEVFFNDIPNGKAYKIGLDGNVGLFNADTKHANGQAFGPDGRLYAAATGSGQILAYASGGKPTVIAEGIRANDLVVGHDGGIYVTQPGGGGGNSSQVWYINPRGEKRVVDTGLKFANGVTLSPDQSLLYVADYASHWVYSYQVLRDGSLASKQRFYHLHMPDTADSAGADGIRVDRDGRLYVTTLMGIQVCDQAGRVNCIFPTPNGKIANLCFGGAGFQTLFATCGERVYKRKLKVRGVNAYEPPIKPKAPRL